MINEVKLKRRKIFALLICTCIVTGIVAAFLVMHNSQQRRVKNSLILGQRYLSEMYYEEAALAFRAAIEVEPKSEEAYIGLADAYIGLGELDAALEAINTAISIIGETDRLIAEKNKIQDLISETTTNDAALREEVGAEEPVIDAGLSEEDEAYLLNIMSGERSFLEGFQNGVYSSDYSAAISASNELVFSLQNTDRFRKICRTWQDTHDGNQIEIAGDGYYLIARSFDTDHIDVSIGSGANGWFVGSAIQYGIHTLIVAPYSGGKANGMAYFFNSPFASDTPPNVTIRQVTDGVSSLNMTYVAVGEEPVEYTLDSDADAAWWPDWPE